MNKSLFTGRTVIELGHAVAGPFTASLMGDFGAEVIKIEAPGKGDMWRQMGPSKEGYPLTWLVTARNKKSVTVNMASEKGQALVRAMVKKADVVVENFRPGTVEKWGLGWQDLHAINPKLVMLMVSGYGQTGPLSRKPGYGVVGEAMSGAIFMTGFPDKPPTFPGFSLGDLTTGLMGAFVVSGALHRRATDGDDFKGECIDLALYESLFRMIEWQIILHDQVGLVPERKGNGRYPGGGPSIFQSGDGKWLVGESRKPTLIRFLEKATGKTLSSDPRRDDESHLLKLTEDWMAQHTAEQIQTVCDEADVVAAMIMNPEDMMKNEQFMSRGSIATVNHPVLGDIKMAGIMPLLANYPGSIRHAGPAIGEHNEEVLKGWLGLSSAEFKSLKEEGVI